MSSGTALDPTVDLAARAREAEERLAPLRSEYPFTPRFHAVEGALQHYVDEGPQGGRTLLFLHGNPTWSFAFRHLIRDLSRDHRCVAPDHVGCGLSDKPADYPYRLARHVENVEALVVGLDLDRITLVLHDWGGAIGMGFARRHPERIERIVAMNTAAFPSERIPFRIAVCRVPVFGRLAVHGLNAFARAATWMAVEKPLSPLAKRGYLLPYDTWDHRVATLAFVEDIPMSPDHPSWDELVAIERALPRFADRPTGLFWGLRDWCFTPEFRDGWLERLPEARRHDYPQAGHYLFEDAREELTRDVRGFLEDTLR